MKIFGVTILIDQIKRSYIMGGTAYAINVVLTDGDSGFVKFDGDGTWNWHLVYDVDEATLYRSFDECASDFHRHVKNTYDTAGVGVDRARSTIATCYCPWL